jgi:ketol-acid reductoisomerase
MKVYTDKDADLSPLKGKQIAVLGYGNQGRAQALNLRDSGQNVIVGNRDDDYLEQARKDQFEVLSIPEAAKAGDVMLILTTDESQPGVWAEQIAPGVSAGDVLVWSSGYNVSYDLIAPPPDVDVIMVAPRMTGTMVRELYEHGKGAMAQVAVHQDASGNAREIMMALAKGIGCTRGGAIESSFREEAELDLFAEQVVWSGFVAWIEECFTVGVEQGFSPELMVLELYASGEASEIMGMMGRRGFYKQMAHHSTTSQYGTLTRAQGLLSDEIRRKMRELLKRDIKEGAFAKEWSSEQADGSKVLAELKEKAMNGPMGQAEERIIPLVQKAHALD